MIISASYRTDIPAFYGEWFENRLAAGSCLVKNPYGGKPYRVALGPEAAEAFVFWTRNPKPFLPVLKRLEQAARPFVLQFTITGYPRALEPGVLAWQDALDQVRQLAQAFGPRAVVWRYDPIFLSDLTPAAWHRQNFRRLAECLAESVDEVVFSFAQIYAKTRRNSDRAGRAQGFSWSDPDETEKGQILRDLAETARSLGLTPSLCAQPALLTPPLQAARCIDRARLIARGAGRLKARERGNRPGCLCAEARDIGAYDSCAQGCVYCYAVADPARAKRRLQDHDPGSAALAVRPWRPA